MPTPWILISTPKTAIYIGDCFFYTIDDCYVYAKNYYIYAKNYYIYAKVSSFIPTTTTAIPTPRPAIPRFISLVGASIVFPISPHCVVAVASKRNRH